LSVAEYAMAIHWLAAAAAANTVAAIVRRRGI